jgi:hypothetical protein
MVTFERDVYDGHVILHPFLRPIRPSPAPSPTSSTVHQTFGLPTPIVPLESHPVHDLSARFSNSTFSSTGLVAESSSQTSPAYPLSPYSPYPQPLAISTHEPCSLYSYRQTSSDTSLSPGSSYAGFSPYRQYQPYTFSNNLSFQPSHPPCSSPPSSNAPLALINPYGMTSFSPSFRLHPEHSVAEHIPIPFSPEPVTFLLLDPLHPLSPASTSSQFSSGGGGFGARKRVSESLEEMLEDEGITRLSKRVALGGGWMRDGSAWKRETAVDDMGVRSSFGFADYPPCPDHFFQSTPAQMVTSTSPQRTSPSLVPPLPSGPPLSSLSPYAKDMKAYGPDRGKWRGEAAEGTKTKPGKEKIDIACYPCRQRKIRSVKFSSHH